jgi:spectinomycin phosphotransferase
VLEPPDLDEALLAATVADAIDVTVSHLEFLPLGADVDSAVYRVDTRGGDSYFLKLRRGEHFHPALMVPQMLADRIPEAVIPPIVGPEGSISVQFDDFHVAMYPYVSGVDGFNVSLNRQQWSTLAVLLRELHTLAILPGDLKAVPHVSYRATARTAVSMLLARLDVLNPPDSYAAQLVTTLRDHTRVIKHLLERASELALVLNEKTLPLVLCHGDIHAGNVLIDEKDALKVVDWDTLVLAPRERDLMFIGAGIGDTWKTTRESAEFYASYGNVWIDQHAIAYFRMERVVDDILAYCTQLLSTSNGGEDRELALHYFRSQFEPGGVLEIALNSDPDAWPD